MVEFMYVEINFYNKSLILQKECYSQLCCFYFTSI